MKLLQKPKRQGSENFQIVERMKAARKWSAEAQQHHILPMPHL
jgi:hypothetical protein